MSARGDSTASVDVDELKDALGDYKLLGLPFIYSCRIYLSADRDDIEFYDPLKWLFGGALSKSLNIEIYVKR